MSSSISAGSFRNATGQARCEPADDIPQRHHRGDHNPSENRFKQKLRGFWRTRITAVVKKVVAESKAFIVGLASRLAPKPAQPGPSQPGTKHAFRATERVNFPQYYPPSPISSLGTASPVGSSPIHTLHDPPSNSPSPGSTPPLPAPHLTLDQSSSKFRYKEEDFGTQRYFPEIETGVVSARVKWLQPLMSGGKDGGEDPSQQEKGVVSVSPGNEGPEVVQALKTHPYGAIARNGEGDVEKNPNVSESDDGSVFDDSPRLFKHRLPKDEPEPWVEPGTVAKGAMWLQPVLSGEKRRSSGNSGQESPTSPTWISHGIFH